MASTEEKAAKEEKASTEMPAVAETPAEEPEKENLMTKVPAALGSTAMLCSTTKETARRAAVSGAGHHRMPP